MTVVAFAKMFDVYITFNREGEGQIFGKGSHPPRLMEKEDFWVPTTGGDTMLLPCLVEDYDYYSSKHKAILITPESNEPDKDEEVEASDLKEKKMTECHDFEKNKTVETNAEVIRVMQWPDTAHLKINETVYDITLFDGKHHFNYQTKSKDIPEEGKKYFLRATVKSQTSQIDFEIPCFEIGSVKLLKEKKKK